MSAMFYPWQSGSSRKVRLHKASDKIIPDFLGIVAAGRMQDISRLNASRLSTPEAKLSWRTVANAYAAEFLEISNSHAMDRKVFEKQRKA